jgi:hypothetical protein
MCLCFFFASYLASAFAVCFAVTLKVLAVLLWQVCGSQTLLCWGFCGQTAVPQLKSGNPAQLLPAVPRWLLGAQVKC